ncbi:MAG: GatB/YqeY domain-containing protein [Patescibacteria group bacterium]
MGTLRDDLKTALKGGDAFRSSTLRMAIAAALNKAIQLLKKDIGLSDEEVAEVVRVEVKKRKDAAAEFAKGGREDLAEKEMKEAGILSVYLPPEMADEEVERVIKEGIRETGATTKADFGKVMKTVMPVLKGKASGDRISEILGKLLR